MLNLLIFKKKMSQKDISTKEDIKLCIDSLKNSNSNQTLIS